MSPISLGERKSDEEEEEVLENAVADVDVEMEADDVG